MKNYTYFSLPIFIISFILNSALPVFGQLDIYDYRTYNGSFNDLRMSQEGQAGNEFLRMNAASYYDKDGHTMKDRGNVRTISNQMFNQYSSKPNPEGLSSMVFTFLQFLDHDITFTEQGSSESEPISIPKGDPHFDPFNTGSMEMPFTRVHASDGTNAINSDNQRQQINEVTAWIDASMVYGSDKVRANWLRSGECGKLKVSPSSNGDLLPCNTITGNCADRLDPNAPLMDGAVSRTGELTKVFVAGDIRANEQPGLTALHTLFVREHNRICEQLTARRGCNDELNYQTARKIVGGLIQSILYNEVLPLMGVDLAADSYKQDSKGEIINSFATAAYRLGHTMITSEIPMIYEDCLQGRNVPIEMLPLQTAFFNPSIIQAEGITPILRGLSAQTQESLDAKIVDPLRNFLFGAPGSGGLDLVALNIQRGRDHGLPDYNSLRNMFGLSLTRSFSQISADPQIANTLEDLYDRVDNVDPWVGMLSEKPLPGKAVGETLAAILSYQFNALRQADRFYYTRDPLLTSYEKATITQTTLADVIRNNTEFKTTQNAFLANNKCLSITAATSKQIIECNEMLIDHSVNGQLVIKGAPDVSYKFDISRDPMGIWNIHSCSMLCGDALEKELAPGKYYIDVKNKRNKEVCKAEIEVIPTIAANSKAAISPDLTNTQFNSTTLSIYPNPASDEVRVNFTTVLENSATIYLINTFGQVLQTFQQAKGISQRTIDVSNFPAGLYTVAVQVADAPSMLHQKVVIE